MRDKITGEILYHRNMRGDGLKPRHVIVWLPPSYRTALTKRYPVLYMHDGQNIFDPTTSYIRVDWQVDEVAESLITAGKMKEVIVVGIYNTPDRMAEYSNTKVGKAYMNFIIKELKPFIDKTYRTLPDRASTATMGSSMGGLISFLLAWHHPDVFSMAACLSPAFIPPFAKDSVEMVRRHRGPDEAIRIYLDSGGVGNEARLQPGCDAMLAALKEKGFKMGHNLDWFLDPKAGHSEKAWSKRVWRPLIFMFGKKRPGT